MLSTAVCLVHFYQKSVCFPAVPRACSPQRDMSPQMASDREAVECSERALRAGPYPKQHEVIRQWKLIRQTRKEAWQLGVT